VGTELKMGEFPELKSTECSLETIKYKSLYQIKSRGSSGSIVCGYGLDDQGSIPDRGRGFFF
jgi:hypothetical protein